jgi:hypothetical protein
MPIQENIYSGVLSDEMIEVDKRSFEFISNLFEFSADTIAVLYKIRWKIELLF